jgi:hypothetical protein
MTKSDALGLIILLCVFAALVTGLYASATDDCRKGALLHEAVDYDRSFTGCLLLVDERWQWKSDLYDNAYNCEKCLECRR